ncbi:tetraspanin 37 [Lepisosteus oculatus]|nr:PREDICTED: tetraspanin-3-like [Lepisosteus oculatus]
MSEPRRRAQVALRIITQLLWLAGLLVGISSAYLLVRYKYCSLFFQDVFPTILFPTILAILAASFLVLSGVVGCRVSSKDSPCLQGIFVYFLIIVFCLVATTAAFAYSKSGQVDSELAPLQSVFESYNGSSQDPADHAVDSLQKELRCCGVRGFQDWLATPWFNHSGSLQVPLSCCNSTSHNCSGSVHQPELLYPQGCQEKLKDALTFILQVTLISAAVIAIIQVMALASVVQLMKEYPLQEYRILDRDPSS